MEAAAETELVALRGDAAGGGGGGAIGSRATAVVDAFYEDLRLANGGDGQSGLGPSEPSSPSSPSRSPSRANQRRFYGDAQRRSDAAASSRRHLERHQDWLIGTQALSRDELRARVALQHFAVVDLEDLALPSSERRSDDAFTDDGVSHQFLLDAGRSDFAFPGGLEMSFRREMEAKGASLEENSLEVEHLLRDFESRLVKALLRSLGEDAPLVLTQAVSRAMSQSGMANLERACLGPQVVVSGGEQTLRYELVEVCPEAWEVRASMRKYQFEQFVAVEEAGLDEPGKVQVIECSPDSQIFRSCAVRFELQRPPRGSSGNRSDLGEPLSVDVQGLVDRVELLDLSGRPLRLAGGSAGAKAEGGAWKEMITRRVVAFAQCWAVRPQLQIVSLMAQAVARCRYCRRRARGSVDGMPSGIGLPRMVCGTEDPDSSMRAPLRDPPV